MFFKHPNNALGGGPSRLYTRSMSQSDLETAESERHGSLDKNKKKRKTERKRQREIHRGAERC
jgi:hypothetical protein